MSKKQTIITPVVDGQVSQQSFLVESSFWKDAIDLIKSALLHLLALIGLIDVLTWFFQ